MKVLVVPCGMRDRMSPLDMADHMEKGIKMVIPDIEVKKFPLMNGYSPLDQILAFGGKLIEADATDPLGRSIKAYYGVLDDKHVVIELKQASGLSRLAEDERNPLYTTTYGTGELIKHALDQGYQNFYIFTKGTSTNDGGIGMLTALGFRFLGSDGESVPLNGSGLYGIRSIDDRKADKRVKKAKFTLVTDYSSLYSGVRGIAYGYGAVKGANTLMIQSLDRGLRNYAIEVEKVTGIDVEKIRGTGAGGGAGAGIVAFLSAEIISFVNAFREMTGIDDEIRSADLVLTGGEKAGIGYKLHQGMMVTAEISQRNHVPMVGIFGYLGEDYNHLYSQGFTGIYALFNEKNPTDMQWEKLGMLIQKMTGAVACVITD